MEKSGRKGASAGQSSSADRNKHSLDIGLLFQELEKSRALAGNNPQIVGGMNKDGSVLADNFGEGAFPCLQRGFAEGDLCTVFPDSGNFNGGSVLGHDNVGGYLPACGCQGKGLGMVSGTVGGDTPGGFFFSKGVDRVNRSAKLEGPALLKRFGLETYPGAGHGIQACGCEKLSPVGEPAYPFPCRGKIFPVYH
jgi:hypothetical protein